MIAMLTLRKEQIDRLNEARLVNFRRKVLEFAVYENPALAGDSRLTIALDLVMKKCDELQVRSERGVSDIFLAWLRYGPHILANSGPICLLIEPGMEKQRVAAFLRALQQSHG
jgi:hypothetical protein